MYFPSEADYASQGSIPLPHKCGHVLVVNEDNGMLELWVTHSNGEQFKAAAFMMERMHGLAGVLERWCGT